MMDFLGVPVMMSDSIPSSCSHGSTKSSSPHFFRGVDPKMTHMNKKRSKKMRSRMGMMNPFRM
jgi:hypothetical protein